MILILGLWTFLRALLGRSTAVTLENVALRHQLDVLQRSTPRFRLRRRDRIFWVCLSRLWTNWRPRPPRNDRRMASPRFPALLVLEVSTTPTRSPAARS